MKVNALLMDEKDNVVTCVEEVAAGQEIAYDKGGKICTLTAEDTIPYCHKAALNMLEAGQKVVKYGEQIGVTLEAVKKGCLVDHNNIYSVPRDYENEYVK